MLHPRAIWYQKDLACSCCSKAIGVKAREPSSPGLPALPMAPSSEEDIGLNVEGTKSLLERRNKGEMVCGFVEKIRGRVVIQALNVCWHEVNNGSCQGNFHSDISK